MLILLISLLSCSACHEVRHFVIISSKARYETKSGVVDNLKLIAIHDTAKKPESIPLEIINRYIVATAIFPYSRDGTWSKDKPGLVFFSLLSCR
jgi:hypothetical protein